MARPLKTTSKYIIRNGRPVSFHVFQEPQADLYQVHISSLGMGLFVKEINQFAHDEGIEEAMKALDKEYGLAVWNFARYQIRIYRGYNGGFYTCRNIEESGIT